jgi:hypothetical protein
MTVECYGIPVTESFSAIAGLLYTHKSFRPPLTPPCQGGGLALSALNS